MQLNPGVVTEMIVFPSNSEGTSIVFLGSKRMLAPLTMAKLIHDQHQTPPSRPRHTHILQLALRLGIVMAVTNEDTGHGVATWFWNVQVGSHKQPWPALEDQVFDPKSLA